MRIVSRLKWVACVGAALMMWVATTTEAQAGWGSHGSWGLRGYGSSGGSWGSSGGSSGGSWGSSGGSWGSSGGSWGSSGGSHGSRGGLFHRIKAHHYAKRQGSWGSRGYYSRGGSSGGYYSSGGSSGGYRYYASSGGSRGVAYVSPNYYSGTVVQPIYGTTIQPTYVTPVQPGAAVPADQTPRLPADQTPPPSPERTNSTIDPNNPDDDAVLNLRLPAKAVVFVNGKRTSTPGKFRSYVSKNLKRGKNYTYEVRAELEREGKKLSRTKVVRLTAGTNKTVDFEFDNQAELITSVTLLVPENAQVSLGGAETRATGEIRYFSTNTLKDGQSWDGYEVTVVANIDGKEVTRRRVLDVNAGDSVSLRFDFEGETSVASR